MTAKPAISKDLQELILAIGHSKSREEEEGIMQEELVLLKEDLRAQGATPVSQAELMIRILYLQLLGFDAGFAYISAINLSQHVNQRVKRLGYLVCCSCISQESELLTLLVSSLQRDLVSGDPLCISSALTALTKVSTVTMVHALVDTVVQLLRHSLAVVRSKAAIALQRFMSVDASLGVLVEPHVKALLLGEDLTCLMAALHFYEALFRCSQSLQPYRALVKQLSLIVRALATKHVPEGYFFYSIPAPWVQIQSMKVLSLIGDTDPSMCIQIANVLLDVLRRATAQKPLNNISHAVIYQVHLTAASLKNCEMVISRSSEYLSEFLGRGNSNNLLYAGVTGLMKSYKIEPSFILSHQLRVLDFLEDYDPTLRNGTLRVLVGITRANNVEAIATKVLSVVPRVQEQYVRLELIEKLAVITERYGASARWRFDVNIKLLELYEKRNEWSSSLASHVIKELNSLKTSNSDAIPHVLAVSKALIAFNAEDRPSDLLKVAIWAIGEFAITQETEESAELFEILAKLLQISFSDSSVTLWLLTALQKTLILPLSSDFKAKISDCAASKDPEIQQRCYELARLSLFPEAPRLQPGSLDFNFSEDLSFLQTFGDKGTPAPFKPSLPGAGMSGRGKPGMKELKFTYGKAIAPQLAYMPQTQGKATQGTGSSTLLGQLWGLFRSANST